MSSSLIHSLWDQKTNKSPFLIAGPCSAESEEQVLATAHGLKNTGLVHAYRAGLWKPRTRPGSFEGVGSKALPWLKRVRQELGILVGTEIAKSEHVELCLKNELDFLWIGARTTVSPFAIEEIAEALKGSQIPVFIKNPINPDTALWIGAIERLKRANIRYVGAIHRGFSWFDQSQYRYAPKWEIPLELKTSFPDIPLLCDPSHIAGKPSLLQKIAQKALDLEMDGLMIESHSNPPQALSDAQQQITPEQLKSLWKNLSFRKPQKDIFEPHAELLLLRKQIDSIDETLLNTLKQRFNIVEKIAEYKKEHNLNILQLERWLEIVETRTDWALENDLNHGFIKAFLQALHQESVRIQTEIYQAEVSKTT